MAMGTLEEKKGLKIKYGWALLVILEVVFAGSSD